VTADPGLQGDQVTLKANLGRIVARAKNARTRFYLMTYPARNDFYPWANDVIRDVARETGAPLIDLNTIFEPLCPEKKCPEHLFPDGHPNASGYEVIAGAIAARLAGRDSL
jgi:lysophospholipase L1-like esterase